MEPTPPIERLIPVFYNPAHQESRLHPLLRFCNWIEENRPFWDYSKCSPYDLLPRFDPKAFTSIKLGSVLTLEPDSTISKYFELTDEDRFKLFHGLPTNTTAEGFCQACRDHIAATLSPTGTDVRQQP